MPSAANVQSTSATAGLLHVDRYLTNYSVRFVQDADGVVALEVQFAQRNLQLRMAHVRH